MEPRFGGSVAPWTAAADHWFRFVRDVNRSAVEATRETAAAFGLVPGDGAHGPADPSFPAMAGGPSDWTVERSVDSPAEVRVGDSVVFSKPLTDRDVRSFARASGDTNRLHLDRTFAGRSRFGGRIVHGTLVAGVISAALARLPGLTIYLSQDVTYLRPVAVGARVTATCEVVEDLGDRRFRLTTVVTDEEGEVAIDGEAVVLIDELPGSGGDG